MREKTEIRLVMFFVVIIILLTILMCKSDGADVIEELFKKYNAKQAKEITQIVKEAGNRYNIDARIIASIIVHESGVRPYAISKGGDYGLMQVRWKVHRKTYKQLQNANVLLEPKVNVFIGTEIFAEYHVQKGTLRGALLKYSGGNSKLADKVINTYKQLRGISK